MIPRRTANRSPAVATMLCGLLATGLGYAQDSLPPAKPAATPAATASLLESLRASHGHVASPLSVQYGGSYVLEGHLSKPHETAAYSVLVSLSIRKGVVAWDSRMGPLGAPAAALNDREVGVLAPAGAFTKRNDAWLPQSPENGAAYAHSLGAFSPIAILAQATNAVADSADAHRILLDMPRGERAIATLDPDTRTIVRVEWPRAHPRLGDVSDVIEFDGFEGRGGMLFPKSVKAIAHEDGANYTLTLTLLPGPTPADIVSLDAAATLAAPSPPAPTVRVEELGPGLCAFIHSDADSRCLVMETDAGLMAFEAPVSSPIGEQIVDAIAKRYPGKPLKGVAVSHYHPHYTGGLRAFVAAGCDVYTTPAMEPFLRSVLARPFARAPDRLQRQPREPTFHIVRGALDLSDASSAVTMIDIGLRSQHTDEYTVFYFPRAKMLFEGDLAYVAPNGTLRIFARGTGLDGALQKYNLDIQTLVQSWPARDTPPLEWKTFVEAANKKARP